MTRMGGYPAPLVRRDFYRQPLARRPAPVPYAPAGEVLASGPAESSLPSFLGILTGLYYVSTVTMSGAAYDVSWVPQLIGAILGLTWIIVGLCLHGHKIRWSKPVTMLLIFTAWTATGFLVTADLDYFISAYQLLLKISVVTWICLQTVRTRRDLMVCFILLGLTTIVVLFQGLDAIIKSVEVAGVRGAKGQRAGTDLMTNANALGQLGVLAFIGTVACLMGHKNTVMRLIAIGFGLASMYLIAASGSRMAMLAVVLFAAGIYWFHFRKSGSSSIGRRIVLMFLAVFLIIGSTLFLTKMPFFFRFKEAFESKESLEKEPRVEYFFRALGATAQHPVLGLGMGGFAIARLGENAKHVGHFSHSSISETLSCTGIPGFLIYFGSYFAMYRLIRKTRGLPLPPQDKTMMDIIMALFVVLILFNIVAIMEQDRLVWPLTGAVLGYTGYLYDRYSRPTPQHIAA